MTKKKHTKTDKKKEFSKKRKEQERTKIAKKLFIEMWGKCRGIISIICDKLELSRQTYYEWRDEDPEFAEAVKKANYNMLEEVEDMLMYKVFVEKEGQSIRYFLDRKHPAYKPKSETVFVPGDKTLEDIIAEDEESLNNKNGNAKNPPEQHGADPGVVPDKKQESSNSTIPIKHGAVVLLGSENKKEYHSQGAAKGNQ